MADINPDFSLYHLTLKSPSGSIKSIVGNFSGNHKTQEIVRATQTSIELWKFNKSTKEITRKNVEYAYANIRNISTFRPIKSDRDVIVVTSDSGMLTLIQYDDINNKFVPLVNEAYFKTGISRFAAGEYVVVDPRGRAILIAAIEKNKLAYTFTQQGSDSNQLSSPVEYKKHNILTFDMVALDVGYENPLFAAVEVDYSDEKHKNIKYINYYEFDLGLNSISLLESSMVDYTANHIVHVPGGLDGPSGVILCSEGMIQYRFPFKQTHSSPIPMRQQSLKVKSIIVSSVVHKMKNEFFILLQNQFGDVFKVTLEYSTPQEARYDMYGENLGPGMVSAIRIRYFDTIPLCTSMIILKSGYLFADYENGDKGTYQFEKLGDGADEKEWSSTEYSDAGNLSEMDEKAITFEVKQNENIVLVDTSYDFNQMIGMEVSPADFIESLPELYAVTGKNSKSAIKVLHDYVPLSEIVTQDLPSKILNAFTCKIHKADTFDKFIILSFFDGSLILRIGEDVEEAENSGFIDSVSTLNVAQIGHHSIVQIHATGLKHIFYSETDEPVREIDWNPPPGIEVLFSACTNMQVVVALSNGDIVYFEKSESDDSLVEYTEHKEFNSSITAICISEIPKGKVGAAFIVVTCKDASIHVLSTDPKRTLKTLHTTKLHYKSSSLAVTSYRKVSAFDEDDDEDEGKRKLISGKDETATYLHVGLDNGIYSRYVLRDDGKLEDMVAKFVVAAPLKIRPIIVTNKNRESTSVVCINSSISFFVAASPHGDLKLVPLPIPEKFIDADDADENEEEEDEEEREEAGEKVYSKSYSYIAPLHSADVPQGVLLTHGDRLTIASIPVFNEINDVENIVKCQSIINDKLNQLVNIESVPIRYTPRALCTSLNPENGMSYIACSDAHVDSIFHHSQGVEEDEIVTYGNIPDDASEKFEQLQASGYPVTVYTSCSCIHVYSNENAAIGQTIELLNGELAYRLGTSILQHDGTTGEFLFVSTIKNYDSSSKTKKFDACYVRVYKIEDDGSLEFLYKQQFERPVLAIHSFQGHVALGCGSELVLFQLGKLQMLKKGGILLDDYYVRDIVDIKSSGNRIFVSDIQSSVHLLEFDSVTTTFIPVIDDCVNRHVTRSIVLDNNTVLVGDKFGSITVLRTPDVNMDVLKARIVAAKWRTLEKFKLLSSFYVGDVITSLNLTKLGLGGDEVILYGGLNGTVGTMSAMRSIKEVNFFKELEKLIRHVIEGKSVGDEELHIRTKLMLIDRDVRKFRSYYVPKRACIDGDLVELFLQMDGKIKKAISAAMDRTIEHIEKRVLEMRNRVGY